MKKMKKFAALSLAVALGVTGLAGCSGSDSKEKKIEAEQVTKNTDKYRNYYEIFVYSFCDSDGDGTGDLQGVISKLDYINDGNPNSETSLGFDGIWMMPIHPSTTYHKYDVTDYYDIDPQYGTLEDFKELSKECDERNISLVIDFVMNHTSIQHEWFKEAQAYLASLEPNEEPDVSKCKYVEYYNFKKGKPSLGVYQKVDGTIDWYYECKFWSGMPDLNLYNENVRKEFEDIAKYWIDLGVDGFRLDAAKEYESDQDAKNIEILTWFNKAVKDYKSDAYIVAEVYSGIGTYAPYLSSGIDSVFDFNMSQGNGFVAQGINGKLASNSAAQFGNNLKATIESEIKFNENYIMAAFVGNHDVDRIAPAYAYDGEKIKMALGVLEMTDGTPFVYYGDEVGIGGSGRDENKRAPMIWSSTDTSQNCDGPYAMEKDKVEYKFASVEEQIKDKESIFNYTRRVLQMKSYFPEIARARSEIVDAGTEDICLLKKTYNGSTIYVAMNTKDKEVTFSSDVCSSLRKYVCAASTAEVKKDGDTITMPAYSIAIFK